MNSPIFEIIFRNEQPDNTIDKPVYIQLAEIILFSIKNGNLKKGQKLPSSRDFAVFLGINRITVSKSFEELQNQGWLESFTGKGTFVSSHIPEFNPEKLKNVSVKIHKNAGFTINKPKYLENSYFVPNANFHLDDGFPDPKLAPLKELYRAYRNQLTRSGLYEKFGSYGNPDGPEYYRNAISQYLNETRGLKTTLKNILSVRGTVMGLNLVCNSLIQPGDIIVSGVPGWRRAENNFLHAKARHIEIPIDEHGLVVENLKKICQHNKVRMVYITPHHHYPTTVSLRIDRRLELLQLASEYGFIIFEDDYDFDFHYNNRPLLPLASADENGMVIYCGSFSKSFSPAFRMGYLAASENVIEHLTNVRVLLDRQGDHILDNAMGEIINDGTVQRYLRKSLSIYKDKRNFFCNLLENKLGNTVDFSIPNGGMTVWTKFDKCINLQKLAQEAYKKGLYFSDGKAHQYAGYNENSTRLGFASSSIEDLSKGIEILKFVIDNKHIK